MEILIVTGLILFGLILMIVELIFIPGTTFVGLIGFSIYGYGIYQSFEFFGSTVGWIVLSITAVITVAFTYYSLKTEAWKRFALNTTNKGKVNENLLDQIEVGQEGTTVSSLKPAGKAEFDNRQIEVRSEGNYIEENQPVRVIKIDNNRIFVVALKA